jgi:thioredoxin reductase (NADPH)
MITTEVENYPGFPEGIQGPEMMAIFRKQAERFDAQVIEEEIVKVDFSKRPFKLSTHDKDYDAKAVIISTGASAKWLGLQSEALFSGYGVSACATCDGYFFRGKEVIVVGGGDTAMEEALFLAKFCKKVYIVHRRDAFRASKIMQDRVMANPSIEIMWNTVVDDIVGELEPVKRVTGVRLCNTVTGKTSCMPIDGVFIAIGHQPNTALFKEWLETDELGYIKVEPFSTRTKIPGVFAAGDVTDRIYRQAVTAAGTGCMAAIDAERFLEAEEHQAKS